MPTFRAYAHPLAAAAARPWRLHAWKAAAACALICSGATWASLARATYVPIDDHRQWQALAIAPLSRGGASGMSMAAREDVRPLAFVPHRLAKVEQVAAVSSTAAAPSAPSRIRGRAGDGLYWSLRAAGASPQVAAQYLAALATEIDVGEVAPTDGFDMVLGANGELLYAGLERAGSSTLQLVRWTQNGRTQWIDAANANQPARLESGMAMPARGPITSYFGYRFHPILHFTRFHAGVDIGAAWGSPIVAAADGRVVVAGWSGGFGREVEIAHGAGITSIYGHMSEIVAEPGAYVHAGQLIGYVGSSGLSTGPHLHFEVRQGGTPVNPLGVRFASAPMRDDHILEGVKARLSAILSLGTRRTHLTL